MRRIWPSVPVRLKAEVLSGTISTDQGTSLNLLNHSSLSESFIILRANSSFTWFPEMLKGTTTK